MDWLKNWDDLVHGTAVFSAAVPFVLAFGLSFLVPVRFWGALVALAIVPAAYWLFQLPNVPPKGSDDFAMMGLLVAALLLALELGLQKHFKWPLRLLARFVAFFAIAWSVYPAWLSADGDAWRKLLVCGGFGLSIALWSVVMGCLCDRGIGSRFSLTPAALLPPTVALAVLLQTGGAMRFAQITGAMAAGLASVCLAMILLRKARSARSHGQVGDLWGMLFVLLGWSGWLFAEIRYGMACLLLCAPLAAALCSLVPALPRKNAFLCLLWDFLASALVALPVGAIAAMEYAAEMAEFEGY